MTMQGLKRQIARKSGSLDATILKLRRHNPEWYAAAFELYARRRAEGKAMKTEPPKTGISRAATK
jgi:hypothetical protein